MKTVSENRCFGGVQGVYTHASDATACDMTVAGLMHNFQGKDALLVAVLENRDRDDLNRARLDDVDGYVDNPRERLDSLVEHNSRQPELIRLYSVLNSESLSPDHPAHVYFNSRYESSIVAIAQVLAGHVAEPRTVAAQLIAVMDGIQMQWLRFPDSVGLLELWHPLADAVFRAAAPAVAGS